MRRKSTNYGTSQRIDMNLVKNHMPLKSNKSKTSPLFIESKQFPQENFKTLMIPKPINQNLNLYNNLGSRRDSA